MHLKLHWRCGTKQTEHARRAHLGLGRLRAWPNLGCLLFGLCTTVVVLAGFRTGPPTPNPISFGPKIEGVRHFSSLIFMQIFLGPARLQVPITTESLWPIRVGIALLRARSSWSNKDYGERSLQTRRNIFLLATPGTLLWCCWFIMNPSIQSSTTSSLADLWHANADMTDLGFGRLFHRIQIDDMRPSARLRA